MMREPNQAIEFAADRAGAEDGDPDGRDWAPRWPGRVDFSEGGEGINAGRRLGCEDPLDRWPRFRRGCDYWYPITGLLLVFIFLNSSAFVCLCLIDC